MASALIPVAVTFGLAVSPVVVPCFSGSGRISPFFPNLVFSYDSDQPSVKPFQRWDDVAANFTVIGNGEPIAYSYQGGTSVPPHVGLIVDEGNWQNPNQWVFKNEFGLGFMKKLIPKFTPFNSLLDPDDRFDASARTDQAGGSHRSFNCPNLRHLLYNTGDPAAQQTAWDYLRSWITDTFTKRPFVNNGANAAQTGTFPTAPFPGIKYASYVVNNNQVDHLGNKRDVNATDGSKGVGGYNAWDRGHNLLHYNAGAAFAGHPLGAINCWYNWAWYINSFWPGHQASQGNGFDQPRSDYWCLVNTIYAWLLGFQYGDPVLIKNFCGGNDDGKGHGAHGNNNGYKPSDELDFALNRIIGRSWGGNGNTTNNFIYFAEPGYDNGGCNDNVLGCVCSCGRCPPPGPGTSGCDSNKDWWGPDGVKYGNEARAVDMWQGSMGLVGLKTALMFFDYMKELYGTTQLPFLQATYDRVKTFVDTMAQNVIDRSIDPVTFEHSAYVGVYSASQAIVEPAGYTEAVAVALWNDMIYCYPNSHSGNPSLNGMSVFPVANRVGEYVVAQVRRPKNDEFYDLVVAALGMTVGPKHAIVQGILTNQIPAPGTETDNSQTDYSRHARYVDVVYALLEQGLSRVSQSAVCSFGVSVSTVVAAGGKVQPSASIGIGQVSTTVSVGGGSSAIIQPLKTRQAFGLQAIAPSFSTRADIGVSVDFGLWVDEPQAFLGVPIQGEGFGFGLQAFCVVAGLASNPVVILPAKLSGQFSFTQDDVVLFIGGGPGTGGLKIPRVKTNFGFSVEAFVSTVPPGPVDVSASLGFSVSTVGSGGQLAVIRGLATKFGLFVGIRPIDNHYKNSFSASGRAVVLER